MLFKRNFFKTITSVWLASILVVTPLLLQTACSKNDIKKAAEASKDLAGATGDFMDTVGKAWQQGLIKLEQKDAIANNVELLADAGKRGNQILRALYEKFGENIPATEFSKFSIFFDDEIVKPFLEILVLVGTFDQTTSDKVRIALSGVRTLVLAISAVFNRRGELEKRFCLPNERFTGGAYVTV